MQRLIEKQAGKKILEEVQKYLMTPVQFEANDPFCELDLVLTQDEILKIRKIVEKTSARDLSLSQVSDHLNVSTKTLSRKLHEQIPWTPAHFFRLIKFSQAGDLLKNSQASVTEICDELGFDDDSNFRRSFKKCSGMTPTQYRRRFRRARI